MKLQVIVQCSWNSRWLTADSWFMEAAAVGLFKAYQEHVKVLEENYIQGMWYRMTAKGRSLVWTCLHISTSDISDHREVKYTCHHPMWKRGRGLPRGERDLERNLDTICWILLKSMGPKAAEMAPDPLNSRGCMGGLRWDNPECLLQNGEGTSKEQAKTTNQQVHPEINGNWQG